MVLPLSRRRGFTLVELLVVISIIGMLMALLFPAVQAAREAGRGNTCRNNMRNLSLAMVQYEQARSEYPGYRNNLVAPTTDSPNNDRSWTYVLLPYLDHRAVYDQFTQLETPNEDIELTLDICICPSNPPETGGAAATNYVVNTGQRDGAAQVQNPGNVLLRHFDWPANGVFHRADQTGSFVPPLRMTSAYISAQDGMGTTLMISENADAARWTGGFMNAGVPVAPTERWMGFTYHNADGVPGDSSASTPMESMGLNVRLGEGNIGSPPNFGPGFARPASYHPNGMNMGFCDGHVRFISDSIQYGVYQALMTPRGKHAMYADRGAASGVPLPAGHAATQIVDEADLR